MVAAGGRITLLPALAVPQEENAMAWSIFRALSRNRDDRVGFTARFPAQRSRYEHLAEAIRSTMDGHFDKALKQAV